MPQQTYEVTAPDGTVLEVTGPAGASQDEVIRQAQALYSQQKAPAPQASAMGATADNASRALLNGMTFGFGDNLEAAIGALPVLGDKKPNESYGQAYDRNLTEIRNKMQAFQQQNPTANGFLDLAGGVIPAALTGGTATGFLKALTGKQALPLAARAAEGAAVGAGYGALGAAGNSNADNTPDLLRAAGNGAMVGGATGGAMPVVSAALQAAAKPVFAFATKINPKDRAYGKTPEAAGLQYTRGITPSAITQSADEKIASLSKRNEALARGVPVDISKAQNYVEQAANGAAERQDTGLANELKAMADFLKVPVPQSRMSTAAAASGVSPNGVVQMGNKALSGIQDGQDALKLKQDFSNAFIAWNPGRTASDKAQQVAKHAYHLLDKSVDTVSPEVAKNNQIISSLIPVRSGSDMMTREAPMMQKMIQRATAMTGASMGYTQGGIPGMVAGAAIPAVVGSPTGQAAIARGLNYPSQAPASLSNMLRYLLSQGGRAVPLR